MSKRHFEFIAQTIKALRFPVAPEVTRRIVAEQFANRLATTNKLFKRERFLAACGDYPTYEKIRTDIAG